MILVIIAWFVLIYAMIIIMWPVALFILGPYAYGTISFEIAISTFIMLVSVFLPVFWATGIIIIGLFNITIEVFDDGH